MMRLMSLITAILFLTGCTTPHLKVDDNGRIIGNYWQEKEIQQIEFYEDGRVKCIQYWKTRPSTIGWSINF